MNKILYQNGPLFVNKAINDLINLYNIDVINLGLQIDHLCYRVASLGEYSECKKELENTNAQLLIESIVGGRLISTFKLQRPVELSISGADIRINVLELPSPKSESFYPSGLEHIEVVIDGALEDFAAKYSNVPFDYRGMNKASNRDLRVDFAGYSVKFHEMSLEKVIEMEKK